MTEQPQPKFKMFDTVETPNKLRFKVESIVFYSDEKKFVYKGEGSFNYYEHTLTLIKEPIVVEFDGVVFFSTLQAVYNIAFGGDPLKPLDGKKVHVVATEKIDE